MGRNVYRMVTRVENVLPLGDSSAVGSTNTGSSFKDYIHIVKHVNSLPIYMLIGKQAFDEFKGKAINYADEAVPNYGIIKNTFLDKVCPNLAKADKTLVDLQFSKDTIKNLFDCEIKEMGNTSELTVSGASNTGKFLSKTLGRIPVLNLALSSACEIPNMFNANKNGDLGKQCVRSSASILLPTIISSMVGQLAYQLAPKSLKTIISFATSIAAGMASYKMTNKTLDKVMGESLQVQNTKAKAKLTAMKNERALITGLS